MENITLIFISVGIVVILYQAFVTFLVSRCRFFDPKQPMIQYGLIWSAQ